MLSLVALSVVSWSFIIKRYKFFDYLDQQEKKFLKQFTRSENLDLSGLYHKFGNSAKEYTGLVKVFVAGFHEYKVSMASSAMHPEVVLENSKRAMEASMRSEINRLEENLSFLATIGSVSPYIGLFGTVWGIMNSFIALGNVQQATLSMVAPGIAEALIATAMGLFVAIPAVIAYNKYATRVNELINKYENFQINFTNVLARKIYEQV
jgi:biopolymer transport protein TolQ